MDMWVILVGVQNHRIAVLECEFLAGKLAARRQELPWRRARRHRQHDVVDELGRLATRPAPAWGPGEFSASLLCTVSPWSVSISSRPRRSMYFRCASAPRELVAPPETLTMTSGVRRLPVCLDREKSL